MKIRVDPQSDKVQLYLEAETVIENVLLLQTGKRIKAPVETFGSISDNGYTWMYINIPFNKNIDRWAATRFGNVYEKKGKKK